MTLNYRWLGPDSTPSADHQAPLGARSAETGTAVLLHGFTQNVDCWGGFASSLTAGLAGRFDPLAIDAPGHGRSGHDNADPWTAAELIMATTARAQGQTDPAPVVVVGYSMGGRLGLHIALAHQELVTALVLIGATAGIADDRQRQRRRVADDALARRFETEPLDEMVRWWLDRPLFARLPSEAAALDQRLLNRPEGLAASLRHCGTGAQDSLWERLGELTMPVLVVHGSYDAKFQAIGARLVDAIGSRSELVSIEGGHAVHLEQPKATSELVVRFLERRLESGVGPVDEPGQ